MILLSGHSLTPERKVPMEALSLSIKERESTATMVPTDMSGISVNSWFKDDTNPGAGIVWRIKSVATAFATKTPTVQLEHVINTLRDRILFGDIKPATITGNPKATSCGAEQAIRYILSFQSDWVLGSFGYNVANPYKFDGETLFEGIEKVSASLPNAYWTYDMSVYPFRLNINPKDSSVASELRAGRNLRAITRTVDKSMMFTRFYPIGKDDLHVDGDFVERNTNLYGVVSKTETDASIDDKAELARWANERLDNHAEPTVTIDVDGLELADATGETLDRLTIGRVCRIPLPEYGTTIQEWITALTYQDKLHQPEVVKITLANNREDVTKIIADAIKGGGKRARTSTKQGKEDHAWFEDTNEHVAMCAIGIIGVDASGKPNWTRLSELVVDGEGIHSKVQSVRQDLVIAETKITQNEYAITLEANRAKTAEGDLSGRLTVAADAITAEVTRASEAEGLLSGRLTVTAEAITQEVTRATSAEAGLSGRITTEADRISLVVEGTGANAKIKPASIVASINSQTGQSKVEISANQIDIDGVVTRLIGKSIAASKFTADEFEGQEGCDWRIKKDSTVEVSTDEVSIKVGSNYSDIGDVIVAAEVDGNNLKLWKLADAGKENPTLTFSKATTLSGSWSSGKFTVSASPQGSSFYTDIVQGAATWNGKTVTIPIEAYDNGAYQYQYATGRSVSATYSGTDLSDVAKVGLDDGWNRWQNYYTAVLYDSGNNVLKTIPGGDGVGLYFPLYDNYPIGANGTYTAPTGYVGFRSVLVNVPGETHTNTIVMKCTSAVNMGGGNIKYTFEVSGTSYSWSTNTDYTFYY